MRLRMRLAPAAPERAGARLRHLIPPHVADAVIAVAVALLGLASGLGGRAQHEHMPLAAIPVLTAMGLVLYPRRRFPAAVLAAGAVAAVLLLGIPQTFGVGGGVIHAVPVPTIVAAAGAALFGLLIRNQFSVRTAQLTVMAERAEWA